MHKTLMALAALLIVSPALAQEHGAHGAGMAIDLPAICLANAGDAMMMPPADHAMAAPSPAHEDLMADMGKMNADMMAGGTASDIDVAFVCSMIPHHRGAIAMAEAELEHGDDPWARELAEKIIAAQQQEIADMLDWLSRQAQ